MAIKNRATFLGHPVYSVCITSVIHRDENSPKKERKYLSSKILVALEQENNENTNISEYPIIIYQVTVASLASDMIQHVILVHC